MITAPSQAAAFAAAYAVLMSTHDVSDHVTGQNDCQARGKAAHPDPCPLDHPGLSCSAASWQAMAGHVSRYHALQVPAVLALRTLGVRPSWRRTVAAVALSAGTHAIIDRRTPVRWVLERTGSPGFAKMTTPLNGMYLADQAFHHLVLAVAAWILGGGRRG